MIAYAQGNIAEKSPTRIVLEINGLGYEIHIPVSTYEKIPEVGASAKLFTYMHVREDALQLYGFGSHEERLLFQRIISVSGIGPRMALGVLSGTSVIDFTKAVAKEDLSVLTKIPGVGKKTAQRLIMELKDKLVGEVEEPTAQTDASIGIAHEAVSALISLGYRRNEAQRMVDRALRSGHQIQSVEVLIKKALQTASMLQ